MWLDFSIFFYSIFCLVFDKGLWISSNGNYCTLLVEYACENFNLEKSFYVETWESMTFIGLQVGSGELLPWDSHPCACLFTASRISILSLFLWNNDYLITSSLTVGMKINLCHGEWTDPKRVRALDIVTDRGRTAHDILPGVSWCLGE